MDRATYDFEAWASITPSDLMRSVRHRLPSIFVTTALVGGTVLGVLLAWPNQYASDGMFYVRLGRGAISVDPTTQASGSVSLQESRRAEVVSVAEMMSSREIADRVVEKVGVRRINEPRTWIDRAMNNLFGLLPQSPPPAMDRGAYERQIAHEEAVKRVSEAIDVSVPKNGYTISVAATTSDPALSQSIVQALMDQYGSYHVQAHRATGSLDFFDEQTRESQQAALQARTTLQQARNEMGWMSTESAETTLRERILKLELALDEAESDLSESSSLEQSLKTQLAKIEAWIPTEVSRVANNATDDMRTVLYEYQVSDGERLAKVTPSHPRYRMLMEKLNQGEQIVSSEGDDREERVEAVNPVHLQLEADYQLAVAKTAGLQSRRDSLQGSLEDAEQDLQRLNEDMIKLAELTWNAEIAEKNFLSHANSLESARVISELDNQNISDVSVIQNASLNLKKVGPPRLTLLLIGSAMGLCFGIFQALVRDKPVTNHKGRSSRPSANGAHHIREEQGLEEDEAEASELVVSLPR
jgi:uncharacterized protein involved in exopolysaccharide biosynthesis